MLAAILALLLQAAYPPPPPQPVLFVMVQQEPQHLPSHRMGPHEGEPNAFCYRGDTEHTPSGRTLYHCECKLVCEGMDVREQDDCETSCSPNGEQCKCHADESCDAPDLQPGEQP